MPHPNGIVIHPDAEIGPNCLLFQQVTIGTREGRAPETEIRRIPLGPAEKNNVSELEPAPPPNVKVHKPSIASGLP